jgi:hypothetical protein
MSQENYNENFINTLFKVMIDDTHSYDIRVGAENVLENLNMPDVASWAYITAWNPLPITYSLEENRVRNQSLKNDLDDLFAHRNEKAQLVYTVQEKK